jgi:hypothetical protein
MSALARFFGRLRRVRSGGSVVLFRFRADEGLTAEGTFARTGDATYNADV